MHNVGSVYRACFGPRAAHKVCNQHSSTHGAGTTAYSFPCSPCCTTRRHPCCNCRSCRALTQRRTWRWGERCHHFEIGASSCWDPGYRTTICAASICRQQAAAAPATVARAVTHFDGGYPTPFAMLHPEGARPCRHVRTRARLLGCAGRVGCNGDPTAPS